MKCYEVTGCSEEMRKSCPVWTGFGPNSPEIDGAQCWVIKDVYHPDQKAQLAKCKKCKYYAMMNKESGVTSDVKPEMVIIRCDGSLNNDRARALDTAWQTIKKTVKEHVILDISGVTNIYSCAIGVIVRMHSDTIANKGTFVVAGAHGFTLSLLEKLNLDKMFELQSDTATAVRIFDSKIAKREELKRVQEAKEEEERKKKAAKPRVPCWQYWNNHHPANKTSCDMCYRKITDNKAPCWLVEGNIEGVTFQFIDEGCMTCAYYLEYRNAPGSPAVFQTKEENAQSAVGR